MKLSTFVNRLAKIGVIVELVANYPWIYLESVNGVKVTSTFLGTHGFTAFFSNGAGVRFSDRRKVFAKLRQMLAYEQYMILTQEISDEIL